ncbi:hypothetical protein BJV82DRAFT_637604 [Fennellomyces sp. T-0311]|nr:hypothetical protein BJV82DRAFT_637604 [Fennellomyces sp. T-0311]
MFNSVTLSNGSTFCILSFFSCSAYGKAVTGDETSIFFIEMQRTGRDDHSSSESYLKKSRPSSSYHMFKISCTAFVAI